MAELDEAGERIMNSTMFDKQMIQKVYDELAPDKIHRLTSTPNEIPDPKVVEALLGIGRKVFGALLEASDTMTVREFASFHLNYLMLIGIASASGEALGVAMHTTDKGFQVMNANLMTKALAEGLKQELGITPPKPH